MSDERWWWGFSYNRTSLKKLMALVLLLRRPLLSLLLLLLSSSKHSLDDITKLGQDHFPGSLLSSQPPIMVGLATTLGLPLLLGAISWSHMGIVGPGPASAAAVVVRQEDSGAAAGIDEGTVPVRASPGCAQKTPVQLDTTLNVTLGDRRYLLYFPVNYKPDVPAPLVLSYHGGTRVAEFQQALDLLTTTYFNQDHIIVYPNGINVGPHPHISKLNVNPQADGLT